MRLFLVRHGAVSSKWAGRIYGCRDVELSAQGEDEARAAAAALSAEPIALVVSSGLARAEFGAARIREGRGLDRVDDPDLREIDRGAWVGLSFEQLDREQDGAWTAWNQAPDRVRPPEGESLSDVAERVLPRLGHWARRTPGDALAVVAHRWVIRAAICHARKLPLREASQLDVPTGGIVPLDWPRP